LVVVARGDTTESRHGVGISRALDIAGNVDGHGWVDVHVDEDNVEGGWVTGDRSPGNGVLLGQIQSFIGGWLSDLDGSN